jgi:hypothetical protein
MASVQHHMQKCLRLAWTSTSWPRNQDYGEPDCNIHELRLCLLTLQEPGQTVLMELACNLLLDASVDSVDGVEIQ